MGGDSEYGLDSSEDDDGDSDSDEAGPEAVFVPRKLWDNSSSTLSATLKDRFRDLDINRDGTLDESELKAMMKKGTQLLTDEECNELFAACDVNGDGKVIFTEFVDFIFAPSSTKRRSLIFDDQEVEAFVDEAELELETLEDTVTSVEIVGGSRGEKSDGKYGVPGVDWVVHASSGTSAFGRGHRNGHRVFESSKKGLRLFHGCTMDGRTGWFLAKNVPEEAQPCIDYDKFNPSYFAESPDQCCAMWETSDGQYDRRMCCKALEDAVSCKRKNKENLLEEELWEASGPCGQVDEWEEVWQVETGEVGDDSDDFENELKALRLKDSQPLEQEQSEDEEALTRSKTAPAGSTPHKDGTQTAPAASLRSSQVRKPKPKKYNATLQTRQHAPGFRTSQVQDHMALLHKKEKAERKEAPAAQMKKCPELVPEAESEERGARRGKAEARKPLEVEDYSRYCDGGFVDPQFPPCQSSLGGIEGVAGWERLPRLHDEACLFRRIVPNDVFCAEFAGNLWFMAACAAVAEYPAWIQSMFGKMTELSHKGKYCVRLYHPGKQRFVRIIIDDYVPITPAGALAFAGISVDGEIWAPLVEKAFAKLCGSYAHSEWGLPAYGLVYLCGGRGAEGWSRLGPSRWKSTRCVWDGAADAKFDRSRAEGVRIDGNWRDEDELWSVLRRYMEMCFPVTCSVDKARVSRKGQGLQMDRSYAILAAREVPAKDGRVLRMVFLRNPFGLAEWKGRWGDSSESWEENPSVKAALRFSQKKDGAFWMGFNDFLVYFEAVDVVRKSMPVQGSNWIKHGGLERGLGMKGT